MKFTATFVIERETKGAVRYEETGADGAKIAIQDGAKLGTVYIRKSALGDTIPKAIKLTIEG